MAQELPNHHDFSLTSVSVGDILYRRDSASWANLHVGTAGQVLTAHGPGLAPSWADAGGGGDLSTAVILAPDTVTRNTIQPTADANVGLTIKGHSGSQSGDWLRLTNSANGLRGVFSDGSDYPVLAVGDDADLATIHTRLLNEASGEVIAASGTGGSATGFAAIGVVDSGSKVGRSTYNCYTRNPAAATQLATCFTLTGTQTQADNGTISNGSVLMLDSSFNTMVRYDIPGQQWFFNGANAAASSLTLVGGGSLKAGFLGATAVAKQPTASTTGIAGIRTDTIAHAVADIQTILTALRGPNVTFGLCTDTA